MASKSIGELRASAGKGFEPFPAGFYQAEVSGATFVRKPGKNPYFKVEFTLTEGPHAKRKQWSNLVLGDSEGSAGYFFSKMGVLGLGKDFWDPHDGAEIDEVAPTVCQALIGAKATLKVTVKEYPEGSGTLKNDVENFSAPAAGATAPSVVPGASLTAGPTGGVPSGIPTLPAGL